MTSPFHALDCKTSGEFFFTKRHDKIRDILVKTITSAHADNAARIEEAVGHPSGSAVTTADIVVATLGSLSERHALDVTIANNPAAPTYLALNSDTTQIDATNKHRENSKIAHYRQHGVTITPFAMEATGRPGGPSAEQLLSTLDSQRRSSPTSRSTPRRRFMALAGILIQRQNAALVAHHRRLMRSWRSRVTAT